MGDLGKTQDLIKIDPTLFEAIFSGSDGFFEISDVSLLKMKAFDERSGKESKINVDKSITCFEIESINRFSLLICLFAGGVRFR